MRGRDLLERLHVALSPELRTALSAAVSEAARRKMALYLVGGAVRDLLLGTEHLDLDLVTEDDAVALAEAVGSQLGARVVCHPRFGTAVVSGPHLRLDLARARAERYERPGALPSVTPAGIDQDLTRRDFTINAIALRVDGAGAGDLLDPYHGQHDIQRKLVRVLHDDSFRDDATRILRAMRYAGRLGFEIEARTRDLLGRHLAFLGAISGARIRRELEQIAREPAVAQIARETQRCGALTALHPALHADEQSLGGLTQVAAAHRDAVLCCLLLSRATPAEAQAAAHRLSLTGAQRAALQGLLALRDRAKLLAKPSLQPSEAVAVFDAVALAAVEAFALIAKDALAADRARRYVDLWRHVRPRLNGRDLVALGVPSGPAVGEALAALRSARLDGAVVSRGDEEELVREMPAQSRRRSGAVHG